MKKIIVWHRRDLRVHDNRALFEASKLTTEIAPVFVIDPFFFRENSETNPDRIEFMFECLDDLNEQYKEIGSSLSLLFGDSIQVLNNLKRKFGCEIYFNNDTNMSFGFKRDKKAIELGFTPFDNDGIQRNGRPDNWHLSCKEYFDSEEKPIPEKLNKNFIESTTTLNDIREKYKVKKQKVDVPKGGTKEGLKRLAEFKKLLQYYPKNISKPYEAEFYTSRLSAHFSLGSVSLRRAYKEISSLKIKQKNFYLTRLFWNQHFTQKLNDNKNIIDKAANPFFETYYDEMYSIDENKIKAWKEGKTGFPLVDASMRSLVQTGFLNFRMRAMVASFFTYVLRQPWKIGADFMHYHLIDADTAINYSQWQMQSGLVGVHPNRIYNPTKQIEDNDPECKFIKKYVPELKDVKINLIKTDPDKKQPTLTGEYYLKPIVNFSLESKRARELYTKLNKKAVQYLALNPEIKLKLSLSNRAKKRKIPETKIV